jgi:sigma-B regulation protein RsbU (phosphoserine phosphatase)
MKPLATAGPLRRLTDVSRALTYARSLDEVLEVSVACATELLESDRALLMLDDVQDGLLRIRAARGIDADLVARFREPLDENLLTRLAGVLDIADRADFMGVPLVVGGRVIGLLGVRLPAPAAHLREDAEWLLSALADQSAVAIENAWSKQDRDRLASQVGRMEQDREGKEQAIQVMSHDLRTPLNAIQGYVALLAGEVLGPVNERQADALRRLRSVGTHLEALLDNVLEMARLEAGTIELRDEPIDLGHVAEEARQMVAVAAERSAIQVTAGTMEAVRVRADASRVRQVLVQLIDNAVKYSPDGGTVRVDVCRHHDGQKGWGEVAVSDSGPGIPEEMHARIFEPYLRNDGTTERSRTGVGLGLAIARALTERMEGHIVLETEVGRGSTFSVRLPLAE